MDTQSYATRSEWIRRDNPKKEGKHIIGLDMGYSAAKGFYDGGYFCIPNFTTPVTGEIFGEPRADDILYEDLDTHKKYYVGKAALESLDQESVTDENALLGRDHYLSQGFRIVARAAIGLALWNVNTDGHDVLIQTGLPPAFLSEDEEYIRYAFEGEHVYKLSYGSETRRFHYTIRHENVDVMKQPMGTFYSVAFNNEGKMTPTGASLFRADTVIFDGGFGTLDKFILMNGGRQSVSDTNPQLGMKRVFEEARNLIKRDTGVNISIPGMQNCLRTGNFERIDHIRFEVKEYPIQKYIEKANQIVMREAMDYVKNDIIKARYLIMTGGTGAAWFNDFAEWVRKGMGDRCTVLRGNSGTDISNIYANARGYYMAKFNGVG